MTVRMTDLTPREKVKNENVITHEIITNAAGTHL